MRRNLINTFESYQAVYSGYFLNFGIFITGYKKNKNDFIKANSDQYFAELYRILSAYKNLLEAKKQEDLLLSPNYSLFDILIFPKPEIYLHSPFIYSLLDCRGEHGQNDLFYRLFLGSFINDPEITNAFINEKSNDYYIKREQYIKTDSQRGFIDIVIQSANKSKKFVVIIENKWDSSDSGDDQVYKYYKFYKHLGYKNKQILMIYLTKHGEGPESSKMSKPFKSYINRARNKTHYPLKYNQHIKNWLLKCIEFSKSKKMKIIINQYLNLINYEY